MATHNQDSGTHNQSSGGHNQDSGTKNTGVPGTVHSSAPQPKGK